MRSLFKALLLSLVMVTALTGCRTAPIYNVQDQVVVTPTGRPLTLQQVRAAIVHAGAALGWQMRDEGQGHMVGTLALRDHMAQVDIDFTPANYSIIYRNSTNLNYDGNNIHSNYNGWIQNLQKSINTQLALQ